MSDKLKAELEAKGRLTWHQESCARLIIDSSQPPVVDTDTVWRIKGSALLDPPALAYLRELWHWREREAIAGNRPPFFVLAHEKMIEVAQVASEHRSVEDLLPPRMHPRRRESLLLAVRAAQVLPPEQFPQVIRHHSQRPSEAEFRRFRELEKIRDRHALQLGIDPTLIAPKATLGDLARDWDQHLAELMGWQRELLK